MAYSEPRETVPNDIIRRRDVVDVLNRHAQSIPNQYDFHRIIQDLRKLDPAGADRKVALNRTDQLKEH